MGGSPAPTRNERRAFGVACPEFNRCCANLLTDHIDVGSHTIVLEPDHIKAQSAQFFGSLNVQFTSSVLCSVHLDNQPRLKTHKVNDVATDGMLSAEAKSADLLLADAPPEGILGVDRPATHRTGCGSQKRSHVLMRH